MYLSRTPGILRQLFSDFVWNLDPQSNTMYLTFDDGPIPDVTPWVIDVLDKFDAKASFFCVGENVSKYPDIFHKLQAAGHTIGNHTYNHLSGWATDNASYLKNVRKGALITGSKLFRPPYGRIKPSQMKFIKSHYQVVMWDVLSGDFDPYLSKEDCYQNVIQNATKGSIIVFHDSLKSKEKLQYVLPRILEFFSQKNFSFAGLHDQTTLTPVSLEVSL
ncbi:MAG: polysaccharide deacetylase family protein [Saprospiraceae bacterium]|nr:polysaccharide deacetylase family protein [Saprospiraceae bacterium]